MRKVKREIVSAVIFSRDGKIFQGRKDPARGGVYSDAWHIPGGGREEGEDNMTALIREVMEETGIDISSYPIELIRVGYGESERTMEDGERVLCEMTFNDYSVTIHDKDASKIPVSLAGDLLEYVWRDPRDLKHVVLTPPSQELFRRLGYL